MKEKIKLSEAIKEGAKIRPQVIIKPFDWDHKTCEIGSCALGAAYEATFKRVVDDDWSLLDEQVALSLRERFPELDTPITHPVRTWNINDDWDLQGVITDLNDTHDWTREAIADYVESLGF